MIREADLGLGGFVGLLVSSAKCTRAEAKKAKVHCMQSDAIPRDGEELFEWTTECKMFLYHFKIQTPKKK